MSLTSKLRSIYLTIAFSDYSTRLRRWIREKRRRLSGGQHVVSVFLQIDDPYSYLLSHYLPRLAIQFDIELRVYLSEARGDEYQPAPSLLAEYAVVDCTRLALELGIPFLDKGDFPPAEYRVDLSDAVAASAAGVPDDRELLGALEIYWRGDSNAASRIVVGAADQGKGRERIAEAQQLQMRLGHYNSAMLHYAGEWYWGVDRLHYLTERLESLGAAKSDKPDPVLASIRQSMKVSLPVRPPTAAIALPPIEYFHSPRSPYSYLALQRTCEIADAFGMQLIIRPVMPMVMRGLKVPLPKLLYIAMDTAREAERRAIPYGRLADPVGRGTERLFAVYEYAEAENKGREFLLNAGVAIWAEAIDIATDKGMRKVTGRTGLFWPDVVEAMKDDSWREVVESNRRAMMDSGSWGVPTIRMGDFLVWGRDRDWMLVRHLEELCNSGDGILV